MPPPEDSIHRIESQFAEIKGALLTDLARIKDDIQELYSKLEKYQSDITQAVGKIAALEGVDKALADSLRREIEHVTLAITQAVRESVLTTDRDMEKRIPEAVRVNVEAIQKLGDKLREELISSVATVKADAVKAVTDTAQRMETTALERKEQANKDIEAVKTEVASMKAKLDLLKTDVITGNVKLAVIIAAIGVIVSGLVAWGVKVLAG